jgi:hypothetical protein
MVYQVFLIVEIKINNYHNARNKVTMIFHRIRQERKASNNIRIMTTLIIQKHIASTMKFLPFNILFRNITRAHLRLDRTLSICVEIANSITF